MQGLQRCSANQNRQFLLEYFPFKACVWDAISWLILAFPAGPPISPALPLTQHNPFPHIRGPVLFFIYSITYAASRVVRELWEELTSYFFNPDFNSKCK